MKNCPFTTLMKFFHTNANATAGRPDPILVWKRGHWLFFLLLQGLIAALRRFKQCIEAKDNPGAALELQRASALLLGSATAMRLAAGFSPSCYKWIVRPSMPDGASGLNGQDHDALIKLYRSLKPIFQKLPQELKMPHQRFVAAAKTALAAHIYVCDRFDGSKGGSLKTGPGASKTAVATLAHLGQNRLNLIAVSNAGTCPFHAKAE